MKYKIGKDNELEFILFIKSLHMFIVIELTYNIFVIYVMNVEN